MGVDVAVKPHRRRAQPPASSDALPARWTAGTRQHHVSEGELLGSLTLSPPAF